MSDSSSQRLLNDKQQTLVLIVAQSARYLAQQAAREGYRVRAIDQFNDTDLQHSCERTHLVADFGKLAFDDFYRAMMQLAGDEPAVLIAGTGVERFYPLFKELPLQFTLANNPFECFDQCCQSQRWFALLERLKIPHPESRFSRPTTNDNWLFKPAASWGGTGIQALSDQRINTPGVYQRQIQGQSFSVLFFADSEGWQWLGTQQQHASPALFVHEQISSHFPLSQSLREQVNDIIDKLNQALSLHGFNCADFILCANADVLLLELNPRPTASMQFLESPRLISAQIRACIDNEPVKLAPVAHKQTLFYLFARHSGYVREDGRWPASCRDLPASGAFIHEGQIICSALIPTTETFNETRALIYQEVMHNIAA